MCSRSSSAVRAGSASCSLKSFEACSATGEPSASQSQEQAFEQKQRSFMHDQGRR